MTLDRHLELPGRMFLNGSTITASLNEALAEGHSVRFGSGIFDIDGTTIALPEATGAAGQYLVGHSRLDTAFTTDDLTIPIISIGGNSRTVADLQAFFPGIQPEPNDTWVDAVAIELGKTQRCVIERVLVPKAGYAIKQKEYADSTVSWGFSCSIRDFYALGFSEIGIKLKPSNTANTGNVLSNVYLSNNWSGTKRECVSAVRMENTLGSSIQQLNIEHMDCQLSAIVLVAATNMVFSSVHYEGVTMTADNRAMFALFGDGCSADISGMDVHECFFNAPLRSGVFRVEQAGQLTVRNSTLRNSSKTATHLNLVTSPAGAVGAVIEIDFDDEDTLVTGPTDGIAAASPPILRRWNDNHYALDALYEPLA